MLKYMRKNVPERVAVLGIPGPFRFSWTLLGAMEKLLLNYVLSPDFSLKLARISTDFVKEVVGKSIAEGAEVICLEGDLASKSNTLMSPGHYRKFIKPYHREICEMAHKYHVPIIKHSDGNIWPILDDLVEVGFMGFNPIQAQSIEMQEGQHRLRLFAPFWVTE
jgi:uroporphyrinogen decarboxylase